jgi:hypothetical protein
VLAAPSCPCCCYAAYLFVIQVLLLLLPALSSWVRVAPLGKVQEASLLVHAVRCCAQLVLGRMLLQLLVDTAAAADWLLTPPRGAAGYMRAEEL